jgi:hypothetical protein
LNVTTDVNIKLFWMWLMSIDHTDGQGYVERVVERFDPEKPVEPSQAGEPNQAAEPVQAADYNQAAESKREAEPIHVAEEDHKAQICRVTQRKKGPAKQRMGKMAVSKHLEQAATVVNSAFDDQGLTTVSRVAAHSVKQAAHPLQQW